eukprot:TRINITY_DN10087_c0_g2_i5.p1 TRINITY_DN10087_c0_g2~~TRINITY_DN10087_c0_g2_i5.p1  ORF type:complete len:196 (+),score=38.33 TRINITY_DN10087_c0_g2_i5:237-824(+)
MGKLLVEEFIRSDFKAKVQKVLDRASQGEETANVEFPFVTKDGNQIEILLNATPRRDANGQVTGMLGVGQDITILRRAMVQSAQMADDLMRLIDTANAPIFGIDREGRVTEWNRKAAAISGWTQDETLGKPLVDAFITDKYRAEVPTFHQGRRASRDLVERDDALRTRGRGSWRHRCRPGYHGASRARATNAAGG